MRRKPPISNRARDLRKEHGNITQAELGKAIGVTRQTVAAIEADRDSLTLERAFRTARLFNTNIENVFTWEE